MYCLFFIYLKRNKRVVDKMFRTGKNSIYMFWFYVFLGSFFLGVFIMNMGNGFWLSQDGIFSAASVNRLKYIEIDSGRFLKYVLKNRMGEGIVLILLSTTGIGLISVYVCIVWQGILAGMTITAAVMRYGIKGLLLLLGGMFPHQLLLIPAQVMLLGWCYENSRKAHISGRCMQTCAGSKKQQLVRQGILLVWIGAVVIIGCILESYVNPILVFDLVKIF